MEILLIVFGVVLLAVVIIAIWINKKQSEQKNTQLEHLTDNIQKFSAKLEPKSLKLMGKEGQQKGVFGNQAELNKNGLISDDKSDKASPFTWVPVTAYKEEKKSQKNEVKIDDSSVKLEEVKGTSNIEIPGMNPEYSIHDDFTSSILLVDDSITVLKFTGKLLLKNNYEIVTKMDGWEALNYLQNTKSTLPDLIITDIEMPNMDGLELIHKIREDKRFDLIPVIIISASAEKHLELMEKGLIQGFLHKPYKEQELLDQLAYVLLNN